MPKQSNVPTQTYRNAYAHLWIRHTDGTVNNTLCVYPFKNSREMNYNFAKIKGVLQNYRGQRIAEVRFHRNGDNRLLGTMDEQGLYHGEMAFMNTLVARH